MRRTIIGMVSLAAAAALACGGDSGTAPELGALKLGIVSGNHQTAPAAKGTLLDPVVGRLVHVAGSNEIRFVHRGALLDGVVVTGSPVPGAVVCAVSMDATHPLTPFTPCTNTDSIGQATFFFYTGNVAGASRAEIRGTLNNQPAVFDTAFATVLPDTVSGIHVRTSPTFDLGTVAVGDTIRLDAEITRAQDTYGNVVTDWTVAWAFSPDSVIGTNGVYPASLPNSGRKPVVPAGARALYGKIGAIRFFLKFRTS